ncbi:MAG: hypothetical protein IPL78_25515 [Chloroflexi bacterium]|nr:hypothetical protein [Chloroflexota bacterium]
MTQEQEGIDPALTPSGNYPTGQPYEPDRSPLLFALPFTGDEAAEQPVLSFGQRARLALARLVAQGL